MRVLIPKTTMGCKKKSQFAGYEAGYVCSKPEPGNRCTGQNCSPGAVLVLSNYKGLFV